MPNDEYQHLFDLSGAEARKFFCGDGAARPGNAWIMLLHPEVIPDDKTLGTDLIQGGVIRPEKLCSMSKHNYHLEPNVSFTPDQKYIVFRSDMFGPTYPFAVEVAKASAAPSP